MAIHLVKLGPRTDGCIEDLWPRAQALVHLAAATSFVKFAKPLVITELDRLPRGSDDVHPLHRAWDFDVDEQEKFNGLLPDEAQIITDIINKYAIYDPERPYLKCCVYGHIDSAGKHWNHGHVQVHPNTIVRDFLT